jgi:hypothetical protein
MIKGLLLFGTAWISLALPWSNIVAGSAGPQMTVEEIVNHNVTARGGLQAWRAVKTISFEGKLGVGGDQRAQLQTPVPGRKDEVLPTDRHPPTEMQVPFVMDLQRPLKMRFTIQFRGSTAVQVFDGTNGWKLRPYLNRMEVEPFTQDELKKAATETELDGPLVDYVAKGTKVELEGAEKVEDRDTYRLRLTLKTGRTMHVWVDAHTWLETKSEGQPRKLDGVEHPVETYYRDYRSVGGLQIPFLLETKVLDAPHAVPVRVTEKPKTTERIVIEKVSVNPTLQATAFAKPEITSTTAAR